MCTGNHRFLVITSAGIPLARKTEKFVHLMRGSLLKNSLHANLLQIVFMCLNHCIYVFKFELFLDCLYVVICLFLFLFLICLYVVEF